MTTSSQWLDAFAQALGVDAPSEETREQILALAGAAAHASERTAAPVACWLCASAGIDVAEALALAEGLALDASD